MRGPGQERVGAVLAGLAAGTIAVSGAISYAALIFQDDLAVHIPIGVGLVLFGALALGLMAVLTSSFEANIAGPQGAPAVVVGLVAGAISSAGVENPLDTVIAFIAVSTATTGVCLFALGYFGFGGLVRYLPLPVIGGYLGGTGALIVISSAELVVPELDEVFTTDVLVSLIPTLLIAAVLVAVFRRGLRPHVVAPLVIIGATVLFHIVRLAGDVSVDEARERGWVLDGFPDGPLWSFDTVTAVGGADWGEIVRHIPSIGAIVLVTTVSLLLNVTGLEHELHVDADVNHELRSAGFQNLAASLGGGTAGHVYLADSVMVSRMTTPTRLIGLVTVAVVGVGIVLGSDIVALVPVSVSAGILLFLGATFVIEWVFDARSQFGLLDYLLVLAIIATVAAVGYLAGLGVGLVIAIGLFVVRYSRTDVVRTHLDGSQVRSNVSRTDAQLQVLAERGHDTAVLELQGFVFFGSAERVLHSVRRLLDADQQPNEVILDFHRVSGLDSSAAQSFAKVTRLAEKRGVSIVFAGLGERLADALRLRLGEPEREAATFTTSLDEALQMIEDRLLASAGASEQVPGASAMVDRVLGPANDLAPFLATVAGRHVADDAVLLVGGEASSGIFFVEAGQVVVVHEQNGQRRRRRSMGAGAVIGEMSWYLGSPNNSTVVADGDTVVRHLDLATLDGLGETNPEVLSDLHRFVAAVLAERLRHANDVVDRLMR